MQFGLTEEQEMIVSTVRGFVETEIYPLEDEVEKLGHVPLEMGNAIKDNPSERTTTATFIKTSSTPTIWDSYSPFSSSFKINPINKFSNI